MAQAVQLPRWRRWLAEFNRWSWVAGMARAGVRPELLDLAGPRRLTGDIIGKSNEVHDRLERLTVADRLLVLTLLADAYPDQVGNVMDLAEVDQC